MAKPLVYGFPSKGTKRSNGLLKPLQLLRSPHTPSPLAFHKFCRPLRSVPHNWFGRAASWESASGFGLRGKGNPCPHTSPLSGLSDQRWGRINESLMMNFFSNGQHKAGGRPRDMTLPWTTQLTLHPLCQHPQNLQSPLPFHLPRPHWTSPCPPLVPAVIRLPISRSMANSLLSLSLSLSHRVCQGRPGAWLPGGHSTARLHRLETSRSLFFPLLFLFFYSSFPFLLFSPVYPLTSPPSFSYFPLYCQTQPPKPPR